MLLFLTAAIGIFTNMSLFLWYYAKGKQYLKDKYIAQIRSALKCISSEDPWISTHEWQTHEQGQRAW